MTELRDQLQASLGDVYAIERELGGGGMSRVFVAEDRSLGRRVVVKVLPAELSGGVSIDRFRREISLVARLQHPHIVPLLAAGEIDGQPYYIMPFVDGESLGTRLSHGELPIAETISLLRDVAKALEFAHSKGIAHRDIKPDNVLITGTSAVIADFGVAKAISDATSNGALTSIGVALGTPAYMAPEQAAADPTTDFRADYYAFGAMAFEMLAGHAPFAGRNVQALLAAHAIESPPSIGALRQATPAVLADLVMRCLEKRPGDRPQTATEIVNTLDSIARTESISAPRIAPAKTSPDRSSRRKWVRLVGGAAVVVLGVALVGLWWQTRDGASAGSEIRSIAVLPFENKSGDTTFDYLEDGITDHVRDALNALPELAVKARSSSLQLKGRAAREVGRRLGVRLVLLGTVSRSSSRLHVTAELVRVSDERQLWSSTFDGQPSDLLGIQDSIAHSVVDKLHLHTMNATPVIGTRGTTDADAYDMFMRGRFAFERFDFPHAQKLFEEAVARDPRFARAEGFLSMTYANVPVLGVGSLDSLLALAHASGRRALAIDSTLAEPYIAESWIFASKMQFADAIGPMERAFALDSTNADVLSTYGLALAQVGRLPEALDRARRARDRDPLSVNAEGVYGYILQMAGQYDAAVVETRAAIQLDPRSVIGHRQLGFAYAFKGMRDSALAVLGRGFALDSTIFGGRSNLVFAYAVAGRWKDAARQRALFDREASVRPRSGDLMVVQLAFGEYAAAMTSLERAVADRDPLLGNRSIPCDPLFDPLKADQRFARLLQRIGARACAPQGNWPITARPR